jgi:hypothetical protein
VSALQLPPTPPARSPAPAHASHTAWPRPPRLTPAPWAFRCCRPALPCPVRTPRRFGHANAGSFACTTAGDAMPQLRDWVVSRVGGKPAAEEDV